MIIKVRGPEFSQKLGKHEVDLMQPGGTVVSFLYPAFNKELLEKLSQRKVCGGYPECKRISNVICFPVFSVNMESC